MASLWATIRKRRQIGYEPSKFSDAEADDIFRKVFDAEPVLINIQGQAEEWAQPRDVDFASMDATPCFRCLWMEWTPTCHRQGILIRRFPSVAYLSDLIQSSGKKMRPPPDGSKFLLQMLTFAEHNSNPSVLFHGLMEFYVDSLGRPLDGIEVAAAPDDVGVLMNFALLAADTLTTMNTHGTRMEPPFAKAQIVKPDRAPCSVWHTIHIPKFRHAPLAPGAVVSPEMLERREHWVRGHRRDYRNGSGMFGRIKALVWVPEFQRGNVELGTVKQSYEVERRIE